MRGKLRKALFWESFEDRDSFPKKNHFPKCATISTACIVVSKTVV